MYITPFFEVGPVDLCSHYSRPAGFLQAGTACPEGNSVKDYEILAPPGLGPVHFEQSVNMQKNLYIPLNRPPGRGILIPTERRRSILVRSAASEEGPKNPFKGITMKPLVPASYAQCGVGAERKACVYTLAGAGRPLMA